MGKKAKVGKARKDKFYHLAKETGYRSRAAFKLIQLNRKYEFLQKSNIIVDLCAAPGGWLQVASENAPMSNIIIGIDLVPIAPIRNVKTYQEDITTEKCRQVLKRELKTAKADCFLNDGAPNLGKNWIHDAYQQVELTLHALSLTTEFLRKGGWFITKLFRSKDYDAIMWVFQQLFKQVHATKPQASRNESAEIFVVCQGYIAPDKIDPKFLDPKYVFQEVDKTPRPTIDLIHPEKKKRQREGYPEGDYTLFYSLPVTEFFASDNFMELLAQSSEIALDSEEIRNHPLTTPEIKECIKDIKLLGKKDIKSIFVWRKKLLKELEKQKKSADVSTAEVVEEVVEEVDENKQDEAEIEELENMLEQKNKEELALMKKAKKKVRKIQQKHKTKLDLKMMIPGDQPVIQDDINIFDITKIRNIKQLKEVEKGDLTHLDKDDIFEESDDESRNKKKRLEYFDKGDKKYNGIEEESDEDEEMDEEPEFEEEENEEEEEEEAEERNENTNPLIIDMGETKRIKTDKQRAWFNKESFAGLEDDMDEDLELEQLIAPPEVKKKQKAADTKSKKQLLTNDLRDDRFDSSTDNSDESSDEDDSDNKSKRMKQNKKTARVNGLEVVPASTINSDLQLDAEGLAIGAAMVQSRKRKREIVDSAYHRYMFDDDNLPDWFVTDEKKHLKRLRPVTKEEMEEYKLKMKAINAQPIKKIAEAKARKKRKLLKRLENVRKKANSISENIDSSEKEKWQQIKQVYKKAGLLKKSKPSVTYVVAKQGAGKKVRRPAGVKGIFKVVDGRMKKDLKGKMRKESKGNKKGSKGVKKGRGRVRK
ncbi:pre-rRNA 2'-O-ribose RNA methyltransferase FTSJ3-like [Physella acuta]|uniref:pre-rRNA 2'-O-ribose RNA methyltransferase FTSJ3-like n=1 Tax=Physella acuta TaxID=109671 RepID=UPI0027DE5415|nr:pre-rRNA 2'-O-ribose RNA methyltransferase FTSJ3-like [Physella acuta]